MTEGIIKFGQRICLPVAGVYANGRKALALVDVVSREPIANATVNLPEHDCGDDEIFVKDWSENASMVDALLDAGLIEFPHGAESSGYVVVPRCRLTAAGRQLWRDEENATD